MRKQHLAGAIAFLIGAGAFAASAQAADWLQFGYDEAHSGNNPLENIGPVGSTSPAQWSVTVHAFGSNTALTSDSTPVYLSGVTVGSETMDLIFLVTQNGTLVAFAANDGSVVWSKRPTPFNGSSNLTTGAAAIDPNRQYVYAYGLDGDVHKYAVADGTEVVADGWPELSTKKPNVEKGASGLAIASPPGGASYLYAATNGYVGDGGDYQGHVTAINLATGTQNVFNSMCSNKFVHFVENGTAKTDDCNLGTTTGGGPGGRDGQMSGIWGRPGVIYDAQTNRIYFATGNGLFDANMSGDFEWGDSVLALNPDGTGAGFGMPEDSYTPGSYVGLYNGDTDLGSTSPAILPSTSATYSHLAIQSGKDSCLRLINLDDMSGLGGPGNTGGELNSAASCDTSANGDAVGGGVVFPQPAVWVNPADGTTWFYVATSSKLVAYHLDVTGIPSLSKPWPAAGNGGTSPVIANGVLYYATSNLVMALNPLTGAQLWSVAIGGIKWQSPIVVNSHLYITDNNSKLWSFPIDDIFQNGFE